MSTAEVMPRCMERYETTQTYIFLIVVGNLTANSGNGQSNGCINRDIDHHFEHQSHFRLFESMKQQSGKQKSPKTTRYPTNPMDIGRDKKRSTYIYFHNRINKLGTYIHVRPPMTLLGLYFNICNYLKLLNALNRSSAMTIVYSSTLPGPSKMTINYCEFP